MGQAPHTGNNAAAIAGARLVPIATASACLTHGRAEWRRSRGHRLPALRQPQNDVAEALTRPAQRAQAVDHRALEPRDGLNAKRPS
jgi:hypothetical protein